MKNLILYLLKGEYRSILIALFLAPRSIDDLRSRTGLQDAALEAQLRTLMEAELIEPSPAAADTLRFNPTLKDDLTDMLTKIGISLTFVLLTSALGFVDKKYRRAQGMRIYEHLDME